MTHWESLIEDKDERTKVYRCVGSKQMGTEEDIA